MNPEPLPLDLRDLEARLTRRPCPAPAADFRARMLSAAEQFRGQPIPQPASRRWRLIGWAAAAIVLVLNLVMSAANETRFRRLAALTSGQENPPRRLVGPDVPNGSEADERFQSLAASALASLRPGPDAGPRGRELFTTGEERRWALP